MTAIPAALDGLLDLVQTVFPEGSEVQIVDGQPVAAHLEADVICVGWSPEELAVRATEEIADLGRGDRESFEITNLVSAWRGDEDPKVVRDRCFELVGTLRSEIQRDHTLGGAVMSARLSVAAVSQDQTTDGPSCTAVVTVRCIAFVR